MSGIPIIATAAPIIHAAPTVNLAQQRYTTPIASTTTASGLPRNPRSQTMRPIVSAPIQSEGLGESNETARRLALLESIVQTLQTQPATSTASNSRKIGHDPEMSRTIRELEAEAQENEAMILNQQNGVDRSAESVKTKVVEWNNGRLGVAASNVTVAAKARTTIGMRLSNRQGYRRRRERDSLLSAEEQAAAAKQASINQRKQRKLVRRRQAFLKFQRDQRLPQIPGPALDVLCIAYMSEDEDDQESVLNNRTTRWIQRTPSWRSEELTAFFVSLDEMAPQSGRAINRGRLPIEAPAPPGLIPWTYVTAALPQNNNNN